MVVRRVCGLLRGSTELALDFNAFMPDGHKIELSDIEVRKQGVMLP